MGMFFYWSFRECQASNVLFCPKRGSSRFGSRTCDLPGLRELKLGRVDGGFLLSVGVHGSVLEVSFRFVVCTFFAVFTIDLIDMVILLLVSCRFFGLR